MTIYEPEYLKDNPYVAHLEQIVADVGAWVASVTGEPPDPDVKLLDAVKRAAVLYKPEPQLGDLVTGEDAVNLPVGTVVAAQKAAMAAVRSINRWTVTGSNLNGEASVRMNTWTILVLPDKR